MDNYHHLTYTLIVHVKTLIDTNETRRPNITMTINSSNKVKPDLRIFFIN